MIFSSVIGGAVSALVTALALVIAVPQLKKLGIIDLPSDRSSHAKPITRGGGVGPIAGIVVGLIVGGIMLSVTLGAFQTLATVLIIGSTSVFILVFAGFGFAEDVLGLRVRSRLSLQVIVSALFAVELILWSGHSWSWLPIIAVAGVVGVNFTNFMDGINGITSLFATVAGVWFFLVELHRGDPAIAVMALVIAVAALTFLPVNAPRARVFLGDIGSYGIGAGVVALVCWTIFTGVPIAVALAPVAIYLADAGFTLLRRILARENLADAHRTHVYQRLTDMGPGHFAVALIVTAYSVALCALSSLFIVSPSTTMHLLATAVGLIVIIGYVAMPWWLSLLTRRPARLLQV